MNQQPAHHPVARLDHAHTALAEAGWLPGPVLAVASFLLAAVVTTLLLFTARTVAEPAAAAGVGPAVTTIGLAIEADPGDEELLVVRLATIDLLRRRLQRVPGATVQPFSAIARPRQPSRPVGTSGGPTGPRPDAETPLAVTAVGTLRRTPDGGGARLSLRIDEAGRAGDTRAATVGEYELPLLRPGASMSAYLAMRQEATAGLVDRLAPGFDLKPLNGAGPRRAEAYRAYLETAQDLRRGDDCNEQVLQRARASLEADQSFAPAWTLYGSTHYRRVASCGGGGTHYREALTAASRAQSLDRTDAEPWLLEAIALTERGRLEEAYERVLAGRTATGAAPTLSLAAAHVLTYAGYLDAAALAVTDTPGADPQFMSAGVWIPNVLLYNGDYEAFLATLPDADTPAVRWYRAIAELERGRERAALQVFEQASHGEPRDVFARLSLAMSAALAGRGDEARAVVHALSARREIVDATDGGTTFKQAQVLAVAGETDGALAELDRAVAQGFACTVCIERTPLFASVRGSPEYRDILHRAVDRSRAFGRRFGIAAYNPRLETDTPD